MGDKPLACLASAAPCAAMTSRAFCGTGLTLEVKIAIFTVKEFGKDE
jgi:hypothetical protein